MLESSASVGQSIDSNMEQYSPNNVNSSATPTRSEVKLQNLYDIIKESSDEFSDSIETDDETDSVDLEEIDVDLSEVSQTQGYRLIDLTILNQNVQSQLVCRFCQNGVQLIEVKQAGLGSEFVFHCENSACVSQTSFPSCPQMLLGPTRVV